MYLTRHGHVTFATSCVKIKSSYRSHSVLPREHQNRTGMVTHFIPKPTNQGSVEVCGKGVNRSGDLSIYGKIPCVYIFDGPRKHVDLPLRRWQKPNLRSGVLFLEERESIATRKSAVWKREKKERVLFSPLSRPPTLALLYFRAPPKKYVISG